jgi:hypothetical protein
MLKRSLFAVILAVLPLQSAWADRDRHDRHDRDRGRHERFEHRDRDRGNRHYYNHSRPRTTISFNYGFGSYYNPHPYYRPSRVVYAPQPVVMQPNVVYINDSNSREVRNSADDRYCREYQASARVGGVSQPTYGTACMQPDGSWEIIS